MIQPGIEPPSPRPLVKTLTIMLSKLCNCLELVYTKNYSNLRKIFVLRLFKMTANQTVLEPKSVIEFWWLRSTNHMKFIKEYVWKSMF